MKKFIFLALLTFTVSAILPTLFNANEAKAQLVTTLKPEAANDTLTNTDTAIVYLNATARSTGDTLSTSVLDNIARSVTASAKKVSGTLSTSKIYLQATVDGINYSTLDSLVSFNSAENVKTFDLRSSSGGLLYKTYRLYFLSAGTCVWVPKGYLLRRSN